MIAVTDLPSSSPSSRAASTVIEATSRWPLTSSWTFAIAAPSLTLVTVPDELVAGAELHGFLLAWSAA